MERIQKIAMNVKDMAEALKKHYGLPPDAMYQKAEYDPRTKVVTAVFKHQTFDMVDESKVEVEPPPEPEEKPEPEKKEKKKNG